MNKPNESTLPMKDEKCPICGESTVPVITTQSVGRYGSGAIPYLKKNDDGTLFRACKTEGCENRWEEADSHHIGRIFGDTREPDFSCWR
jgi:hypothetical protein